MAGQLGAVTGARGPRSGVFGGAMGGSLNPRMGTTDRSLLQSRALGTPLPGGVGRPQRANIGALYNRPRLVARQALQARKVHKSRMADLFRLRNLEEARAAGVAEQRSQLVSQLNAQRAQLEELRA